MSCICSFHQLKEGSKTSLEGNQTQFRNYILVFPKSEKKKKIPKNTFLAIFLKIHS